MPKNRTVLFILLYAAIVVAMLFVFMFVQERYGADTSGPYKRRFLDKFFLEAPKTSAAVLADSRLCGNTGGKPTLPSDFRCISNPSARPRI